ncbi:hypothetical protein, partial [Mesorhizobium sp. M1A.T.Ca.IN.004.03.1.1]|uniref:hypothetical protein n=1 Tax=Mesorhizobium sp. M1A.T.Ca.IN.004.03.1.1 TaxID=2496795 RepID=UPI0019D09917
RITRLTRQQRSDARPLDVRQFVPFGHPSRSESEPSERNESTPNRVENPECRLDLVDLPASGIKPAIQPSAHRP